MEEVRGPIRLSPPAGSGSASRRRQRHRPGGARSAREACAGCGDDSGVGDGVGHEIGGRPRWQLDVRGAGRGGAAGSLEWRASRMVDNAPLQTPLAVSGDMLRGGRVALNGRGQVVVTLARYGRIDD